MRLNKKPFVNYTLDSDKKDQKGVVISVWFNNEELQELQKIKSIIEQPKDSTAIKTLYKLGYNLIGEKKIRYIIDILFKNKRNNERLGITEFEQI